VQPEQASEAAPEAAPRAKTARRGKAAAAEAPAQQGDLGPLLIALGRHSLASSAEYEGAAPEVMESDVVDFIAAEAGLPQSVAHHDDRVGPWRPILLRKKCATDHSWYAERVEVVARDEGLVGRRFILCAEKSKVGMRL
jgi:hypothetical protein